MRFLVNIALVLAVFMLAEAIARAYYHPAPAQFVRDDIIFWKPKSMVFPEHIPHPPKRPGEFRILCLGDSIVNGLPSSPDAGFPAVMQDVLGNRFFVINTGVPGFTSYQGKMLTSEICQKYDLFEADLVLIHYLNNDRMLEPVTDEERRVLYRQAQVARNTFSQFAFYCWLRDKLLPSLHFDGRRRVFRVPPEEFRENLLTIKQMAKAKGAKAVFVILPHGADFVGADRYTASIPIESIDLRNDQRIKSHLVQDGVHFDSKGYDLIGRRLAAWIKEEIDDGHPEK